MSNKAKYQFVYDWVSLYELFQRKKALLRDISEYEFLKMVSKASRDNLLFFYLGHHGLCHMSKNFINDQAIEFLPLLKDKPEPVKWKIGREYLLDEKILIIDPQFVLKKKEIYAIPYEDLKSQKYPRDIVLMFSHHENTESYLYKPVSIYWKHIFIKEDNLKVYEQSFSYFDHGLSNEQIKKIISRYPCDVKKRPNNFKKSNAERTRKSNENADLAYKRFQEIQQQLPSWSDSQIYEKILTEFKVKSSKTIYNWIKKIEKQMNH